MSLRARLVASLAALLAVGLAIFGWGTYRAFASSELGRIDAQLERTVDFASRQLLGADQSPFPGAPASQASPAATRPGGGGPRPGGGGGPGERGEPRVVVAPGTYAELRTGDDVMGVIQATDDTSQPDVDDMVLDAATATTATVPSSDGEGLWRVRSEPVGDGQVVVVGLALDELDASLSRLLTIELLAGLALLLTLGAGAWMLLRHGLRPLEEIASTAGSITAGRLDQRVPHAGATNEVGQLAGALNGMLDELEGAFRERDATEAKLRRFLADASHELRTPLTSIRGFAELFRLGADSPHSSSQAPPDLPTIMRRIEEESERMGGLVEDLLLLARLDEHRPVEMGPVDLAILAADACSDAVATAPDRAVALDAPEPVVVEGNEPHLRQALANLVGNALTHTPAGTRLDVRAFHHDGHAVLEVRDHGPGLSAESLQHAFDRFWQADAARVGSGAGLGLSIVAAIASEHGGTVTAANAPDGGAVFSVRLPSKAIPRFAG